MKKKSRIPEFKTIEEEAKFWDTHSFADYWDEFKDVDVSFDFTKPKDDTIIVRLQKELKEKMEQIARRKGLSVSTLARMWFIEKLQSAK